MSDLAIVDPREVVAAAIDPTQAVVALLGQARAWLDEAQSIEDVIGLMAKADAIRAYTVQAKLGQEAEQSAREIRVRAEVRIGELLGPATPGRPKNLDREQDSLTDNQRHDFRKLAEAHAADPDAFDERVDNLKRDGRLSRSALLGAAKKIAEAKQEDDEDRAWEREVAGQLDPQRGAIRTRRQQILGALLDVREAAAKLLGRWSVDDVLDAVTLCACGTCADCTDPLRHVQQQAADAFSACLAAFSRLDDHRKAAA